MIRSKNNRRNNLSLGTLFFTTFLIHFAWTAYLSNTESLVFVEGLREVVSTVYSGVGFEWKGRGAYLVTAALLSSVIANSIRRFIEAVLFGWPQFKEHDTKSLGKALSVLIGYGAMMCLAIGFIGEKYSSSPIDLISIGLISTSTYIFGLLVDFIDDVISGVYSIFFGG